MTYEDVRADLLDNMRDADETDAGLTQFLQHLLTAVERQIPRKVEITWNKNGRFVWICPGCGVDHYHRFKEQTFCPVCGQNVMAKEAEYGG